MALTLRTLAQWRDDLRVLIRDTDTATPSFDDARCNFFLNQAYVQLKAASEDRTSLIGASTWGMTAAAGDVKRLASISDLEEVVAVYLASDATAVDSTNELERMTVAQVLELQAAEPTRAAPSRYATERLQKTASTASASGAFVVWLHPIPDTTYYLCGRVKYYVAQLTGDSHTPDCNDEEQRVITLRAARQMAKIMGHDDAFIADLDSQIPERYQAIFGLQARGVGKK